MDQFQYLSLSASPTAHANAAHGQNAFDTNNTVGVNGDMPPLSPISPVLKHEADPFSFEWPVKREPGSYSCTSGSGDMPDADCPPPLSNLFNAFALPPLPPAPLSVDGHNGNGDVWSQLAAFKVPQAVPAPVATVRFAANPTSVPRFTFNMPPQQGETSSAPSSPQCHGSHGGHGMIPFSMASSSAASSRAASPLSTASEYDDEEASSPLAAWSPSSSVNSPSSMSIRSSLSAFRSRASSISSSASSASFDDNEVVECDSSPDADDIEVHNTNTNGNGSLSPLADAAFVAARSAPLAIPRSSSMALKGVLKQTSSFSSSLMVADSSSGVLSSSAPMSSLKIRRKSGDDTKRSSVSTHKRPLIGPTGLPVTPMCSPSTADAIAAATTSTKASLHEVGNWTIHFVPDCDNVRPPKAKATPLNIVLAPPANSSMVPVRIRLRPQAPRSFRNVVKTARTYGTMHGVAPPADASDKDPNHFMYFSITAVDSVTKLAGPQAAHVAGRTSTQSADRTRRQAKFKHADDKKEYQGHVQLDLSQPGDGARLQVRLYSAVAASSATSRYHVVTSQCDHKFAHMYVKDMNGTSSRV